jgi:DHA3 family tetracycline resistance protein-like MFS transporter
LDSYRFYLGARVYYAICWTTTVTVSLVFMVEVAGLDPLQMVLVGTALELSVFIFEIPTGVVADAVSRRLSVIIGHALVGLGYFIIVLWPTFEVILVSNVIWGFGYTFISGAYPAWLTSELGVSRANEAFLRGSQLGHLASFFGIFLAVGLAHVSLALPIALGSLGIALLAVGMLLFMREDHFEPTATADRETWAAMREVFMAGVREVRGHPILVFMLLITAVFGMFSEGIDRLFVPYLIESFEFPALGTLDTVTWWGIIAAVSSLAGLGATTLARRNLDLDNQILMTHVLAACLLGISVLVLTLANLDGFFLVLACYWLVGALRSAYGPVMTAWLNHLFPESSRATLFSMYGQADAIGQTAGGPVVGLLAKHVSIAFALSVSAFALVPTLPLFNKIARVLGKERALEKQEEGS